MEDNFVRRFLEIRIGERYQLRKRLGEGACGLVYLGRDVYTNQEVAIKLEDECSLTSYLDLEASIYNSLRGKAGIPSIFWHGSHDQYQVMVFELLGPSLEDLLEYCGGHFSLKTTLLLMDQLLRRLECLHTSGYAHRDIKPNNFLLGTGKQGNMVYMIDLGLATRHSPRDDRIGYQEPLPFMWILTEDFQDVYDDLESLGYMILYFLRGPLLGLQASNRDLEQKRRISVEELCEDQPLELATYMNYLRNPRAPNQPDYTYLRSLIVRLFRRSGYEYDNVYDWTIREYDRLHGENPE